MSSEAQKEKCIVFHQETQIDDQGEGVGKSMVGCRIAVFTFCTLITTKNMKMITSDI